MSKDHYQVLGIAESASSIEIKRAYKKLELKWHPDKNPSPEAAEKFRGVQAAYQVLSNFARRQAYDKSRGRGRQGSPDRSSRSSSSDDDMILLDFLFSSDSSSDEDWSDSSDDDDMLLLYLACF